MLQIQSLEQILSAKVVSTFAGFALAPAGRLPAVFGNRVAGLATRD
jgi:hypothetical protein